MLKYLNELANKDYGIKNVQEEIKNAEKIGAKIIPACDPDYPNHFKEYLWLSSCVITMLGDISLLSCEIIVIIGGVILQSMEEILPISWHLI